MMSRGRRVPGIRILTVDETGSGGTQEGWWGTSRVYLKANSSDHAYVAANEFLCARLAAAVGLPVPAGEVVQLPNGDLAWAVLAVEVDGGVPPPEDEELLVVREPDLTAGTFAFDVWVYNNDRHEYNLVSHPTIGTYLIDHDQALGGDKTGVVSTLKGCESGTLGYHLFQQQLLHVHKLNAWVHRIRSLPKSVIARLATECYQRRLLDRQAADGVANFLLQRQTDLSTLVKRSLRPGALPVADDEAPGGEEP